MTNLTYINAATVCELLHRLAQEAARLQVPVTVVLDNAPYQRCVVVQACAQSLRIELLYLPPYSPQLILIERFWRFVKKQCLYATYYALRKLCCFPKKPLWSVLSNHHTNIKRL